MGYVQDTAMSQYITPALFVPTVGTWTLVVGQVAGSISRHRAAENESAVLYIPIMILGNAVALKGALLKSIEVDYENTAGAITTSMTPVLEKVARGAEGAVAVVSTVVTTFTPSAATLLTQTQHKLVVTLTTPEWVDNDVYYLLQITIVAGAGASVQDFLAAVANFTLRV